jgi:hypothetical protein
MDSLSRYLEPTKRYQDERGFDTVKGIDLPGVRAP